MREPIEIAASITTAAIQSGKLSNADETASFFETICDVIERRRKAWFDSQSSSMVLKQRVPNSQE